MLHPRTSGFVNVVHSLKRNLFALMDATIGYVDFETGERCNELLIAQGRFPKAVYLYIETFTVDDIVAQFKKHYQGDLEAFTVKSYATHAHYTPSTFVTKKKRMSFVEDIEETQIVDNALEDFVRKSFELKEMRLKDWYENGRWMCEEQFKIEYSHIPRSHYIAVVAMFIVNVYLLRLVWLHAKWYLVSMCVLHTVCCIYDTVGKIVRSHKSWVDEHEKALASRASRRNNSSRKKQQKKQK